MQQRRTVEHHPLQSLREFLRLPGRTWAARQQPAWRVYPRLSERVCIQSARKPTASTKTSRGDRGGARRRERSSACRFGISSGQCSPSPRQKGARNRAGSQSCTSRSPERPNVTGVQVCIITWFQKTLYVRIYKWLLLVINCQA